MMDETAKIYNIFLKNANDCLMKKDSASVTALNALYNDKKVVTKMSGMNDFFVMNFVSEVYKCEIENKYSINILNLADNVKDMCDAIQSLKFLIWRTEFWKCMESKALLVEYVMEGTISIMCLYAMICNVAYDVTGVMCSVADVFVEKGEYKKALELLIPLKSEYDCMEVCDRIIDILQRYDCG